MQRVYISYNQTLTGSQVPLRRLSIQVVIYSVQPTGHELLVPYCIPRILLTISPALPSLPFAPSLLRNFFSFAPSLLLPLFSFLFSQSQSPSPRHVPHLFPAPSVSPSSACLCRRSSPLSLSLPLFPCALSVTRSPSSLIERLYGETRL